MFDINAKSLVALVRNFPNDEACIKHLEKLYWTAGSPVSPFDNTSTVYKCKNNRYRCKNTGKYFTVTTGTMFENTKINLTVWFIAIWLVACHKTGISSYQLARDLGVTQKTAWYMLHKIRKQMEVTNESKLENEVEIDETYIGGKNKNRHWDKKVPHSQGRSHKDKTTVVGMIERGGLLVAKATKDTTSPTLSRLIRQFVAPSSTIYTDENSAYNQIGQTYERYFVDHGRHQYGNGNVTTNRIEAAWTHLKRMIIGMYRKTSKKYLQKYVDEFVFRYNLRDVSDSDKFNLLLCCADTRITHKQIRNIICAA